MVKPNPPSDFSQRFAKHVRELMAENEVTQAAVAARLGRAQSFVSERTGGVRPTDMELLEAIAGLIPSMTTRTLIAEVLERMGSSADGETVTPQQ